MSLFSCRHRNTGNPNMRTLIAAIAIALCASFIGYQVGMQAEDKHVYIGTVIETDSVYDGDTVNDVMIHVADYTDRGIVWPGVHLTENGVVVQTNIRIEGMDAPEMKPRKTKADGTARSEKSRSAEKALAVKARVALMDMLFGIAKNGFIIKNPQHGKYAGRTVAEIWVPNPEQPGTYLNVSDVLIEKGLAHPYDGRGARQGWD